MLRKYAILVAILCSALGVDAVPLRKPYAQFAPLLQLKFAKGQSYFLEQSTKTTQLMTVMGQEVKQTQEQTFIWRVEPLEETRSGEWLIQMRMVDIRFDMDIGGNKIEFDSSKNNPASPMREMFKLLLETEWKATISRDGAVHDVEKGGRFGNALQDPNPLFKQLLNADSRKRMIAPLGEFIPPGPAYAGMAWSRHDTLDQGPIGNYLVDFQYRYLGSRGMHHDISFGAKLKYVAPEANKAGGMAFVIKDAVTRKAEGKGTIVFDEARGRLHESTQDQILIATLDIEIGGQASRIELNQTQTSRVRTLDVNPLEKPANQ